MVKTGLEKLKLFLVQTGLNYSRKSGVQTFSVFKWFLFTNGPFFETYKDKLCDASLKLSMN
jgi:hypothetical protein